MLVFFKCTSITGSQKGEVKNCKSARPLEAMASYQTLDGNSTAPSDFSDGSEEYGVPAYGFKVNLDHKFPEKWKPLKRLRIHQVFSLIMPLVR